MCAVQQVGQFIHNNLLPLIRLQCRPAGVRVNDLSGPPAHLWRPAFVCFETSAASAREDEQASGRKRRTCPSGRPDETGQCEMVMIIIITSPANAISGRPSAGVHTFTAWNSRQRRPMAPPSVIGRSVGMCALSAKTAARELTETHPAGRSTLAAAWSARLEARNTFSWLGSQQVAARGQRRAQQVTGALDLAWLKTNLMCSQCQSSAQEPQITASRFSLSLTVRYGSAERARFPATLVVVFGRRSRSDLERQPEQWPYTSIRR